MCSRNSVRPAYVYCVYRCKLRSSEDTLRYARCRTPGCSSRLHTGDVTSPTCVNVPFNESFVLLEKFS